MREIKFRAKRADSGEWVEGNLVKSIRYGEHKEVFFIIPIGNNFGYTNTPSRLYFSDPIEVCPTTISQFTGLTDKNGKEVYDGDIVRHRYKRVWQTEFHESRIYWNQEWSCFYLFDGISNHRMRNDIEYEIIGNIHDNPELLK